MIDMTKWRKCEAAEQRNRAGRMTPAAGPATSPFQKLVTLTNRVATKFNGSLTDLSPGVPHGHQYCLSLRADYILPPKGATGL